MINRKLNQIILALLVIGALVTFWTGETVRSFRERNAAAETRLEESSAAETKVEPAVGPSVNVRFQVECSCFLLFSLDFGIS